MGFDSEAVAKTIGKIEEGMSIVDDPKYFGDVDLGHLVDICRGHTIGLIADAARNAVFEASGSYFTFGLYAPAIREAVEEGDRDSIDRVVRAAVRAADDLPDSDEVVAAFEEAVDEVFEAWKKGVGKEIRMKLDATAVGVLKAVEAAETLLASDE